MKFFLFALLLTSCFLNEPRIQYCRDDADCLNGQWCEKMSGYNYTICKGEAINNPNDLFN